MTIQEHHITSDKLTLKVLDRNSEMNLSESLDEQDVSFYDFHFAEYTNNDLKKNIGKKEKWHIKYASVLPYNHPEGVITIGEHNTPLVNSKKHPNGYYKEETRNPSGCFKDRECAVLFPYLKEQGYKKLSVASSGNAALSAALYASLYEFELTCYVPEKTTQSKLNLIQAFGGNIEFAGKNYEEAHRMLAKKELKKGEINITAGVHPLKDQGNKLIAYEIYEEIGTPHAVLVPSGNGCLLFAIFQGFMELQTAGIIKKTPQFYAIQIENASPLELGIKKKTIIEKNTNPPESKAEGIIAEESFSMPKAIHAIHKSNGGIITINEKELEEGMKTALREEGLIPEWTAAATFAAMKKFYSNKKNAEKIAVGINTGSGNKQIKEIVNTIV